MLQLLNPIWLFGISGILIPLIIHLWNVKTGKTLKVGSIMLMGESSRQNSRSLKLMDLLLLFLRCLLIILLSVLLAEPVWRSAAQENENKAWVLLEKDAFTETYSNFKNEIDSLLNAGNELRLFQPGFEKADLEKLKTDTGRLKPFEKLSYWSLINLMEQEIPPCAKAFIFTGNRLSRFKGNRPASNTEIRWKTYTPSDSSAKWISNAYLTPDGDMRVILSESSISGTSRSSLAVTPGELTAGIKSTIAGGQVNVLFNDQTLAADTSTLRIAVNTGGFQKDAEYLIAALEAIRKYTSRKIRFVKSSSEHDILFWLSAKELPATNTNKIVFKYANGKVNSVSTWLEPSEQLSSLTIENIPLHKRINYPEKSAGFSIWEDGFGKPLLDLTQTKDISLYTFYSRLDPEWSDLVWSPEFVKLMLPLIITETNPIQNTSLDKRSIANSQALPLSDLRPQTSDFRPQTSDLRPQTSDLRPQTSENLIPDKKNLQHYIWLLLMGVFITERYLSFRNNAI